MCCAPSSNLFVWKRSERNWCLTTLKVHIWWRTFCICAALRTASVVQWVGDEKLHALFWRLWVTLLSPVGLHSSAALLAQYAAGALRGAEQVTKGSWGLLHSSVWAANKTQEGLDLAAAWMCTWCHFEFCRPEIIYGYVWAFELLFFFLSVSQICRTCLSGLSIDSETNTTGVWINI